MASYVQPAYGLGGEDAVLREVLDHFEAFEVGSFLDAGCGEGKYILRVRAWKPGTTAWALDAHPPALAEVTADRKICGNMPAALHFLESKSVDAVICLDAIEHLSKPDGLEALREFERLARRLVVIFTPRGFVPQEGERPWQRHLSGWEPQELEALGYEVFLWKDFDYGRGVVEDAIWATKEPG